ncbi:uncharacterized protein [Amphiura filiformis]|uniref:uncharacterized protein n=1 Tax=Amphiura filiformis TaxID=82378 RepID=UPI003B2149F3
MEFDVLKVVSQLPIRALQSLHRDETRDIKQFGQKMNRYLQGKIFKKFPLCSNNGAASLLKMILEDGVGKINTFCLGEYAYDIDKCSVGDTLIIANPLVETSPHFQRDKIHRFHLIIGERDQPCHVWVMPARQGTQTDQTDTQQVACSSSVASSGSNVQQQDDTCTPAPRTPDRQTTATMQGKSPNKRSYLYTKLVDVKETNSVNIYGVVKFFKPPKMTSGADYYMMMTLIDPSLISDASDLDGIDNSKGLKCNLFRKEIKLLPQVLRVGDIVRLHRVKVQLYNNELQAVCNPGFASLVFDGRMGTPLKPRSSSAEYTVTQQDKDKVRELQRWANTVQLVRDSSHQQREQAPRQRTQSEHTNTQEVAGGSSSGNLGPPVVSTIQHQDGTGTPAPRTPDRQTAATTQSTSQNMRSFLYTKLVDVKETNSVNIYGVVKFFKPPRKTNGTDYFMALTLIDPSLTSDRGLKCNLFRRELKSLPKVLRVGDIVRLHCIKVQLYNNELQAVCNPGFASLVFDGRMGTPLKPRSSSAEYTVTQQDKDKVRGLQRWANTVMRSSEGLSNPSRTLSDVFIGQYFDLTCQVVAKALLPSESAVLLKVWDGTKCSWPVRDIDAGNRPIEWDDTAAFRAEGLTVDVCLYDDHVPAGEKIQPGNYICLYNLHALKYSPPGEVEDHPVSMGEFCLHRGTSYGRGVTVMPQYDPDIQELIRKLDNVNRTGVPANSSSTNHRPSPQQTNNIDQSSASVASNDQGSRSSQAAPATRRLFSKSPNRTAATGSVSRQEEVGRGQSNQATSSHCMQRSASIITDHVHIKTSSIAEVKAYKEPYLFRVRAQVSDFVPNDVADFVILFCPKCQLRCKVPHPPRSSSDEAADAQDPHDVSGVQTRSRRKRDGASTSGTSGDEALMRRSTRNKAAATSDTSDNDSLRKVKRKKLANTARQQGIEHMDKSIRKIAVVRPSNMKRKTAKRTVKGHKTTAELEDNRLQSDELAATVRLTVEDLSVQDALLLAHQGVKLQGYPHNVDSRSTQGDPSTPRYYVCPRCSPDDRSTTGEDTSDDTASLLQYEYCIKLFLRDDSGTIPVVVKSKHAETFFEDIPPVNLHDNVESKLNLEEYMRKLCPYPLEQPSMSPNETDNSHPWLDACIMSYPGQVRGQHMYKYHLFHTALALDVE